MLNLPTSSGGKFASAMCTKSSLMSRLVLFWFFLCISFKGETILRIILWKSRPGRISRAAQGKKNWNGQRWCRTSSSLLYSHLRWCIFCRCSASTRRQCKSFFVTQMVTDYCRCSPAFRSQSNTRNTLTSSTTLLQTQWASLTETLEAKRKSRGDCQSAKAFPYLFRTRSRSRSRSDRKSSSRRRSRSRDRDRRRRSRSRDHKKSSKKSRKR